MTDTEAVLFPFVPCCCHGVKATPKPNKDGSTQQFTLPLSQSTLDACLREPESKALRVNDPDTSKPIPIVDGHVHLFPDGVFRAQWRWFETYGWPIRYQYTSPRVVEFLSQKGVDHMVGFGFSHKDGMAASMNAYMSQLQREHADKLTCLGTVMPGEADATNIVEACFAAGLHGLKLHCHVQRFSIDEPRVDEIIQCCIKHNKALLIHAGNEPSSPGYAVNTYKICNAIRTQDVLRRHPQVKLCVPHCGLGEINAYSGLLDRFDNLYVDTTMTLSPFLNKQPHDVKALIQRHSKRVMYGSDFPNIFYPFNNEVDAVADMKLTSTQLHRLMHENAEQFYAINKRRSKI